ncbi:hypothetical protein SLA2020_344010 [Shorea laevis]
MDSFKEFHLHVSSCGLPNINAQPSVHVIYQRFEELKRNNGALNKSFSSNSSSRESETDTQIISKKSQRKDVDILSTEDMLQPEETQIDLNEFLQQLGIVREEKQSQTEGIGEIPKENLPESVTDSNIRDFKELAAFAEKCFNWDAVIELNGIGADQQGANPSFHVHDNQEELTWPTSIWNF